MMTEEQTSKGKWYVVKVVSSQEKKVKRGLEENLVSSQMEDYVHRVVIPAQHVCEIKKGERKITEKKLWPGYILVQMTMTDESWGYVKHMPGVLRFVDDKTALEEEEVESLLQELESKKENLTQKYEFKVGERVKVVDGVFLNFEGEIVEIFEEKGILSAMVEIFGRHTRVDDLEFWQVEPID